MEKIWDIFGEEKEFDEIEFQKAYKKMAIEQGLSLDPDDPKHFYDYRALYKETGSVEPDETGHFLSKYKKEGHPRMVVGGVDTKIGIKEKKKSSVWDVFEPTTALAEPVETKGATLTTLPSQYKIKSLSLKEDYERKTLETPGISQRMRGIGEAPKEYNLEGVTTDYIESNKNAWEMWFKELQATPDKIKFLKGENWSPELEAISEETKSLGKKASELGVNPDDWIETGIYAAFFTTLAVSIYPIVKSLPANILNNLAYKVEGKTVKGKELVEALRRVRYAEAPGIGKPSIFDKKVFAKFIEEGGVKSLAERMKGITITETVPRFAFAGKLYAGVPIDEMVKAIVETGKITKDIANALKVMDPVDTGLVFQQLSIASPAIAEKIASEFVKLIPQKITKIPKAEEEMTPEEVEELEKLKAEKIIPEEEIEPTKVELEAIEKPEAKIEEKLPEGWTIKVGGYQAEGKRAKVDWRDKVLVFEDIEARNDPEIVAHEIAHIILGSQKPDIRKAILDEYTKVGNLSDWEVKHGFHNEKFAIDYTKYFSDPANVSPELKSFFDKISSIKAIEKPPTTKEKFMAKMEEIKKEKIIEPIEKIEKVEPEPTPEEIKSVFMEEGNLETTVENRELFYGKYNEVYTETKKGYDRIINEKVADLKEEGFKGVEKGGVKRDEEGYVIGEIPAVSRNPKWYRDFYALHNKKPSNKDLKEIAKDQLLRGHTEDYGEVPPNEIFVKLEAQLDSYEAILSDIKGGDYSFETPKNIDKLNTKLKELSKENKKVIKEYEEELVTLRAEKESKFKELYKEVEAREKVGIEVGVKKGIKEAITGKKLKGLSEEKYKRGNKIIGQIHKLVHDKGLTKVEFSEIKMKYGYARKLSGKAKRMSIEQLQAVLKAVNRARPKIIEHKHVITTKTERKIQSLKDNLIEKMQMSEEEYRKILKSEGVYKEPKYVDGKHFITETKGKEIIYRLIDEANILRETLPYDKEVEKLLAIKKLIDKEKAIIGRYRDRGLKDPKELNSARIIFQKMEEITGAPIYRMYQSLIDVSLENKEKVAEFIHGFAEYKDIIKNKDAIKRVSDYITSKSNLKDKPGYPSKITTQEIELAKKIEGVLRDYRGKARTEKFLENIEYPERMPQYIEFKKEIDKAKDIYESKGYDDLVEYMKTQEWGIIRNGYDPLQVVSKEIRQYKPDPQTFGKSHIKVRTDIEYHEQDRNVLERLFSYKKQMDNLVDMRPRVRAFVTLIDENIDKFRNPERIKKGVEIFLRELKGYNRPEGLVERELNRAYAQAMQVIILPSPAMFSRNVLQPIALGFDKSILIDPRNKKLTAAETKYMNTYVSQMKAMKIDWFMVGEKPYFGKIGAGLMNIVNKVGIYPYSDQLNRITSFWARINQVRRAFEGVDKNSTEKELKKALIKAKFDDIERTERIMALQILGKDDVETMAMYLARVFTADTQFQYNRAERSFAEMGPGKWLTNLMLFPRSYNELLLKQAKHFKEGNPRQKLRASKVFVSIIVGGMIMSAAYKKVTGRRRSPYGFLELLAYEPGGLAIGTIEAATDVYVNTIMAVGGDEKALAALTTAVPRLANMWMPFYDYTLRGYEAATNQKNVDVKALRKIREMFDKDYKTRGSAYEIERTAFQKWQYFIAGAGVDVGIKEEEAKRKAIPKSEVWEEVEDKKEKSDVWETFKTEEKSSVWDTFD